MAEDPAALQRLLEKFQDKNWEPGFDSYREHLARLNGIIKKSGAKLEGNLFYYHETPVIPDTPDPRRRNKRRNFAFYVATGKTFLEIGFNAGHSCLLALSVNPALSYEGIDIGRNAYTEPCFEYLKSAFGARVELTIADARTVLPGLRAAGKKYDRIHVDGGHDLAVAESNLMHAIELIGPGGVILFDCGLGDGVYEPFVALVDYHCARGDVSRVTLDRMWPGVGNVLLKVNR